MYITKTIRVRSADYPALYKQFRQEAVANGYTELMDYLDQWCNLDGSNISNLKLVGEEVDAALNNREAPRLNYREITRQARALGAKCLYAGNDRVGAMHLRDYGV
jgi:hypothetical protein